MNQLFYFAGHGSIDDEGKPTIVSADSRLDQLYDIGLDELSNLARGSSNLVTVLDAEFTRFPESVESGYKNSLRSIRGDTRDIRNMCCDRDTSKNPKRSGGSSSLYASMSHEDIVERNIEDEKLIIGGFLYILSRSLLHSM